MKIHQRFIMHLLLSLGLWFVLLIVTVPLTIEVILPYFGWNGPQYEWLVMVIIGVDTLLCIIISGYYLGTPLLYILGWIKQLANGDYTPFQKKSKMYSKKNKLHLRFQLYSEVIMQVEQLRQQLLAAKQASEEMETGKRDWIAGVSHDLKTPLTYIKSYAALLNAAYDWSEEEKSQFLQDIYDKGTHMEQLVNDLNLALRFDSDQIIPIYKESKNIISFIQQLLADIMNDPRAENTQFVFDFNQEKRYGLLLIPRC